MNWLEVCIETTSDASEAIAEVLMQMAAQGIATQDPSELRQIYESPDSTIFKDLSFLEDLGDVVVIRAYFPEFKEGVAFRATPFEDSAEMDTASLYAKEGYPEHRGTREDLLAHLEQRLEVVAGFLPLGRGVTGLKVVQDADWAEQWKQYYHPIDVSPRLAIAPTWVEYEAPRADMQVIRLDPGSAFGTGDHPTTALCLSLIDEYMVPSSKVADVGCGSGILGIGASLLGARHVDAVDIDPNAITVTKDNASINGVSDRLVARVGELSTLDRGYDLVVANLVADLLVSLAESFVDHVSDFGLLIVSGIVTSKVDRVKEAFETAGFELFHERSRDEWHALVYAKKDAS